MVTKAIMVFIGINIVMMSHGQDINLLQLRGTLAATFLNPAIETDKKINVSLGAFNVGFATDGPAINDITSKNAAGQRYIDIRKKSLALEESQNIFYNLDLHTLDLSYRLGKITLMAGHGFRSFANLNYPKGLLEVATYGNTPFIGQQIQVGPAADMMAFNELYLGLQKSMGHFSLGIKAKLLYGTASIITESSDVLFTTSDEYYQWELKNDILIRSSALFRYNRLDSISLQLPGITLDNLFYNNRGWSVDMGATFKVNKKITLSASALDLGSIRWDFFPRKYTSQGKFVFDGLNLADYIEDIENLNIKDTLLDIIKVKSSIETYSTTLNPTFTLGGTYQMDDHWTFNGLYILVNDFTRRRHSFSLSAVRKISVFDVGLQYHINKNDFFGVGVYSRIRLGPFSGYISTGNIPALFRPFDAKSASLRFGTTLQF